MRPETKEELLLDKNVIPNNIDTSQITDMSELFKNNKTFNKPIYKWNTNNVTSMKRMFIGATSLITAILLMGYKGNGKNYQWKS